MRPKMHHSNGVQSPLPADYMIFCFKPISRKCMRMFVSMKRQFKLFWGLDPATQQEVQLLTPGHWPVHHPESSKHRNKSQNIKSSIKISSEKNHRKHHPNIIQQSSNSHPNNHHNNHPTKSSNKIIQQNHPNSSKIQPISFKIQPTSSNKII